MKLKPRYKNLWFIVISGISRPIRDERLRTGNGAIVHWGNAT